jgi:hypothetical protein
MAVILLTDIAGIAKRIVVIDLKHANYVLRNGSKVAP